MFSSFYLYNDSPDQPLKSTLAACKVLLTQPVLSGLALAQVTLLQPLLPVSDFPACTDMGLKGGVRGR